MDIEVLERVESYGKFFIGIIVGGYALMKFVFIPRAHIFLQSELGPTLAVTKSLETRMTKLEKDAESTAESVERLTASVEQGFGRLTQTMLRIEETVSANGIKTAELVGEMKAMDRRGAR